MAVALRQTVSVDWLLNQWKPQGFQLIGQRVLSPVPGDQFGNPLIATQLDAFEWVDVTFLGFGSVQDPVAKLQQLIRQGGSELHAYAVFQRTELNALGFSVIRHRILLYHSIVQLLEAAVFILAAAFAAIIFWQYMTTGQSPALKDLQGLWGSAVSSIGQAIGQAGGQIGGAISQTYIIAAIGIGVVAIALSSISKTAGVKAPPAPHGPRGSVGVRGGGFSASASS